MCDITLDNFDAKYHEINHSLQKANFVAIDTEFTGLHLDSAQPNLKDTANERYKKLKKSIQAHNIVQIGLSTFRYCNEQRIYVNDSYNFYLFPRSLGCSSDFNCTFQSSCVDFLCRNKFDFNKLFYKGISYLNNKQEKQLENVLKQELLFAGIERDIDERQLQKVCSEVADWLLRSKPGDYSDLNSIKDLQPALVLKELRDRFDSVWAHQVENKIIVEHVTLARKKELELSDKNEKNKLLDSLMGFTKIFRLLVEYKKPIIVHNGFMDLLYLHEKFYEPLPDSIKEFKKNINNLFPLIYDTKLISIECKKNDKQMKELYDSTILDNLYTSLNRQVSKKCFLYLPSIKHSPHSTDYSKTSRPHEAAYDAYMCGTAFLKLAHAITSFESKQFYNVRPNNMNDYFLAMKPYENKINLIKASLDYIVTWI